ncbi:MAG TPA: phosphoglycolate phosphatase [Burkholderiales bacterium]|jgi:phosphoglycolate phosphatase|nr:phosphoglycolate phosphatase [Burkholderiales bacterium]
MDSRFPLRVKAVTIDLDGTLADSVPDLAVAANLMQRELGRPELPQSLIRTFVGKGIPRLVERVLAGALDGSVDKGMLDAALPVFERCYAEVNGAHTTIFPGVTEGLDALRALELPLACVTNKAARFTIPLLERLGIAHYFAHVISGDTLPQKKPDPAPLLYACRQFGIAPLTMLMIGDSVNDAAAARAAGCPVFCVPYGYNEGRDVRALDVDAIVATLFDATRLIQKI